MARQIDILADRGDFWLSLHEIAGLEMTLVSVKSLAETVKAYRATVARADAAVANALKLARMLAEQTYCTLQGAGAVSGPKGKGTPDCPNAAKPDLEECAACFLAYAETETETREKEAV